MNAENQQQKFLFSFQSTIEDGKAEIPVNRCDQCQRGYTYCVPFDRWYEGNCPRSRHSAWDDPSQLAEEKSERRTII